MQTFRVKSRNRKQNAPPAVLPDWARFPAQSGNPTRPTCTCVNSAQFTHKRIHFACLSGNCKKTFTAGTLCRSRLFIYDAFMNQAFVKCQRFRYLNHCACVPSILPPASCSSLTFPLNPPHLHLRVMAFIIDD